MAAGLSMPKSEAQQCLVRGSQRKPRPKAEAHEQQIQGFESDLILFTVLHLRLVTRRSIQTGEHDTARAVASTFSTRRM